MDYNEFNRFDGDYGKYVDFGVDNGHPGPKHNKEYVTKLFNHIYKNFNEYLPSEVISLQSKII
jgi:hypothetical protein